MTTLAAVKAEQEQRAAALEDELARQAEAARERLRRDMVGDFIEAEALDAIRAELARDTARGVSRRCMHVRQPRPLGAGNIVFPDLWSDAEIAEWRAANPDMKE